MMLTHNQRSTTIATGLIPARFPPKRSKERPHRGTRASQVVAGLEVASKSLSTRKRARPVPAGTMSGSVCGGDLHTPRTGCKHSRIHAIPQMAARSCQWVSPTLLRHRTRMMWAALLSAARKANARARDTPSGLSTLSKGALKTTPTTRHTRLLSSLSLPFLRKTGFKRAVLSGKTHRELSYRLFDSTSV